MDAEVEEGAALGGPGGTDALEVDGEEGLVAEEAREDAHDRVEPLGVSGEELRRAPAREGREAARLGGGSAQGLLDEDVSPGRERPCGGARVGAGRRGDDDDLGRSDRLFFGSVPDGAARDGHVGAKVVRAGDFEPVLEAGEDPHVPQTHGAQPDEGRFVPPRRPAHSPRARPCRRRARVTRKANRGRARTRALARTPGREAPGHLRPGRRVRADRGEAGSRGRRPPKGRGAVSKWRRRRCRRRGSGGRRTTCR